jgi:YggT family protein
MGIIITAVDVAFQVYTWLLIIRILLSWVRHNPYQPVIRFIYEVTEPFLGLFRRIIPPIGPLDLSPIVAFFVLQLIRQLVYNILRYLA